MHVKAAVARILPPAVLPAYGFGRRRSLAGTPALHVTSGASCIKGSDSVWSWKLQEPDAAAVRKRNGWEWLHAACEALLSLHVNFPALSVAYGAIFIFTTHVKYLVNLFSYSSTIWPLYCGVYGILTGLQLYEILFLHTFTYF